MQGAPSSLQSAMCITAAGYSTMQEALATIAGAAVAAALSMFAIAETERARSEQLDSAGL